MSDVSYRVCDRSGWSKFCSLGDIDKYLTRLMDSGHTFWPIKRIVKVTSEEVPFSDVVRRYNKTAIKAEGGAPAQEGGSK